MVSRFLLYVTCCLLTGPLSISNAAMGEDSRRTPASHVERLIRKYCVDCHSGDDPVADLDLAALMSRPISSAPADWENVVKKLTTRQMPPRDSERPTETELINALGTVTGALDRHAIQHPRPGRTATFRRLTRFEYQNAIRDLLALQIDATKLLPTDEVSHGFDNITAGELSPSLLNRYVSAAQKISRMATGHVGRSPDVTTVRVRPDLTQDNHLEGLPLGTRGGTTIKYNFPQDGEYEIQVRLARDRNEHVEGLSEPHELEILLDLERKALFKVTTPRRGKKSGEYESSSHANVDRHLKTRFHITAGPHEVATTFLAKSSSLLETRRQPLNVHYNMYRHPRLAPAVYQVSILGPFHTDGPGDSPSRKLIFNCQPPKPNDEDTCAKEIISRLLRRAIRRPINEDDLVKPMRMYQEAAKNAGFETGIEFAIASILVHPEFLFRIEQEPEATEPGTVYRIRDTELASRLSFFLWSSIPDDELLSLAESKQLHDPKVLEQQTLRMLADSRSRALVENFASQWLYLRNLDSITPDARLFPDFGDNLRQAFRRETELFFESVIRNDESVLNLIDADYTFLNERLAKHYGIPNVYGSRFRRVSLSEDSHRGGLLRHGSVLTVTSYATRTSPVLRGKWVLENIFGTPPPPPPPDIPDLEDNTVSANLPLRQRLAQHRAAASCAVCHDLIDPIGFSLENYDAVGQWRVLESGEPVDTSGGLPDGTHFDGVRGLERGIIERPDIFANTLTEKLLTYALGRGLEYYDAPAVRQIVRNASLRDYRFSSLILGIVQSQPFQMKASQ